MQLSTVSELVRFDLRSVELIKWVALVAMIIEHTAHFGFGVTNGWPFVVGRLAFPLFTVSLALGCAQKTIPELRAVVVRLATWGVVAGVAGLTVRDAVPLNVLFTFALGAVLHVTTRDVHVARWFIALIVLALTPLVEYGVLGVVAVACAMHGARQEDTTVRAAWLLFALLVICCVRFNIPAVISIPALFLLNAGHLEVPRMRGVFYWAYAFQWPFIAAVAVLL